MLQTREQAISDFLSRMADEISISETMQKKAVSSYEAVGNYLDEGIPCKVSIMPQGSMNLGTTIRPLTDADDGYDIDLVCLLEDPNLTLSEIKNTVGKRLKESIRYASKIDEEGKRCWTLHYDGFHMDILPCVPRYSRFLKPMLTEIKLTHKVGFMQYIPKYSNPYQYQQWFEERMKSVLASAREAYARTVRCSVEDVPTYAVKTPLQKAIQLLKRHRDIFFKEDDTNAPISIIITTLAAHAYNGEVDLYEVLRHIIREMPNYIERRDGRYWIPNPTIADENFAEKWNESGAKATAFYEWLEQVKTDLIESPLMLSGIHNYRTAFGKCLGEAPAGRVAAAYGAQAKAAADAGTLGILNGSGRLTSNVNANGVNKAERHNFYGQ